jgi:hypothetical protein
MPPEDIREIVHRQPFQPFRLTLTDGRTVDVQHPELIMVGRSSVVVGTARPNAKEPIYDRYVTISLLHVMQIEPLESPASPSVSSN